MWHPSRRNTLEAGSGAESGTLVSSLACRAAFFLTFASDMAQKSSFLVHICTPVSHSVDRVRIGRKDGQKVSTSPPTLKSQKAVYSSRFSDNKVPMPPPSTAPNPYCVVYAVTYIYELQEICVGICGASSRWLLCGCYVVAMCGEHL